VNTLQPPFYEHMVGNLSSNFTDIIIISERIEIELKNGKTAYSSLATTTPKTSISIQGRRRKYRCTQHQ